MLVLLSSLPEKKNPIAIVSNSWTQEFDNHPHIDGSIAMPLRVIRITRDIALLVVFAAISHSQIYGQIEKQTLNTLFIGNSYTGRHNLSEVVETLAEEENPQVDFEPIAFIYGGRNLYNHWNLGTQNIVRINSLTEAEQQATIARIEEMLARDPDWTHGKAALRRHQELLGNLDDRRVEWDLVVLQSWRDDLEGAASLFVEYAPKFASIAKEEGARVLLYVTTPNTQNAEPLTAKPDSEPIMEKARTIARLANRIGADVAPAFLAGLRCQEQRPDLTLRFVNDAHLNHAMAYLTACSIYSAIFEKSPEGLSLNEITDIRFFENDPKNKDKDRDGNPITKVFSEKDRSDLQRIAWESYLEFDRLRQGL